MKTLLKLIRIKDWYYFLGLCLIARLDSKAPEISVSIFKALIFNFIYLSYGYSFNNYFDTHEDSVEKNLFKSKHVEKYKGLSVLLLNTLVIWAGLAHGLGLETLLIILMNTLYSVPPIRLKRFMLPSIVCNSLAFSFIYYSSAKIIHPEVTALEMSFLPVIMLLFIPIQYIHYMEHQEEEDRPSSPKSPLQYIITFLPILIYSALSQTLLFAEKAVLLFFFLGTLTLAAQTETFKQLRIKIRNLGLMAGVLFLGSRILLKIL